LNKVEKPFLFLNRPNPYLSPFLHLICPILASGLWVVQLISGNQIKSDSSNLFHSATFEPVARQLRFNIPHPSKGGYPKSKSHRPIFWGKKQNENRLSHSPAHPLAHTYATYLFRITHYSDKNFAADSSHFVLPRLIAIPYPYPYSLSLYLFGSRTPHPVIASWLLLCLAQCGGHNPSINHQCWQLRKYQSKNKSDLVCRNLFGQVGVAVAADRACKFAICHLPLELED